MKKNTDVNTKSGVTLDFIVYAVTSNLPANVHGIGGFFFQDHRLVNKVENYCSDEEIKSNITKFYTDITDEKFAFAAGQVIEYILSKSKSADNSYNLLEPYLQQSKCAEFKKAMANDFGRYKHENFSKNFEKVAAFVLSYETDANLKHLLPQILSGVFSKNQLFSTSK